MSSKILRSGGTHRAAPMLWPALGGKHHPVQHGAADGAAGPADEMHGRIADARQAGYHEGEAAGRNKAELEIERLGESIRSLASARAHLLREAEGDLLRLSVTIARRILHRELAVDPEAVEGLIRAALDRLSGLSAHRVRVHPELAAALRTCLSRQGIPGNLEIVPDASQERGAVVFETSRGNLDASVETQLQEIERGLADRLRRKA